MNCGRGYLSEHEYCTGCFGRCERDIAESLSRLTSLPALCKNWEEEEEKLRSKERLEHPVSPISPPCILITMPCTLSKLAIANTEATANITAMNDPLKLSGSSERDCEMKT